MRNSSQLKNLSHEQARLTTQVAAAKTQAQQALTLVRDGVRHASKLAAEGGPTFTMADLTAQLTIQLDRVR